MARIPLLLILSSLLSLSLSLSIWPIPVSVETGNQVVWFTSNTRFEYSAPKSVEFPSSPKDDSSEDGSLLPPAACAASTEDPLAQAILPTQRILTACYLEQTDSKFFAARIEKAIQRAKDDILKHSFVPWRFHPKGSKFEPAPNSGTKLTNVKLVQTGKDVRKPKTGEVDESYSIELGTTTATITAKTSIGLLHGLETFKQLFYKHSKDNKPTKKDERPQSRSDAYCKEAPVKITDKPVFPHRGLNLDVARQWYPVEAIKRQINALAVNKFNRLHFHVTESQSWPLEIPSMPELAQKGAYYDGLTYSPEDIQGILDYAEDRGIQVVVEIDMPGHTTSIAEAYPDLIVAKNKLPDWDRYAAQPPSGTLKLNNPKVDEFVKKLLDDLLPRLKAHTTYYHSGGDEVNKNAYLFDENVKSNDSLVIQPHIQNFVLNAHKNVARHGFSAVVWEEMLLEWNIALSKDTIVQSWLSAESVKKIVDKGYRTIAGAYEFWYLDCGNGQWLDFTPQSFARFYPFNDYCSPKKSWRLMYSYDPVAGLTPEQAKLVVGGEVHMWSEQTDAISVDQQVWPRACAAGEVLWSGRKDAQGQNRTFEDASQRLGVMRERLVGLGVGAGPLTQLWCHQNEGACKL